MRNLSNASDEELLSTVLSAATVRELSQEYATYGNLRQWFSNVLPDELQAVKGIGSVKAKQFCAMAELVQRCHTQEKRDLPPLIRSPEDTVRLFSSLLYRTQEEFHTVLLDTKHRVLACCHIATGTLDAALVSPKEVFSRAVKRMASALILVHNHPSGEAVASQDDKALTMRMVEAGKFLEVRVLDHIILGHQGYASAKEEGWL